MTISMTSRTIAARRLSPIFLVLGLVLGSAGCPAGKAADTVKSDQPKVSKGPVEAGTGKLSCEPGKNYETLAVDWDPEMRGDLEVAMKQGIVLLEYTCDKLAILDDCGAVGGYGFIGMSRKEKVVQMKDADEVKANLPLHGVKWVADAKVGMERGTSLNVAMMMIGMRKSARRALGRDELEGDCDGATHYVSAATLGAFVMASGSAAKVEAAASFFGKGAEGASSSATEVHSKTERSRTA